MKPPFFACIAIAVTMLACQPSVKKTEPVINQPVTSSKHTASFNTAIDSALSVYYQMTEAFVQWDSLSLSSLAKQTAIQWNEVDVSNAKFENDSQQKKAAQYLAGFTSYVHNISTAATLDAARRFFQTASEQLAQFLQFIKYDSHKLFLQECPMAFNDEETATWISAAPEIRNPYLGLHHPRYKSGMLHCGTTKEEINYTGTK
ncbi:MAG: DUF3347 domain-containing protein [Bacteroidota bacterium]